MRRLLFAAGAFVGSLACAADPLPGTNPLIRDFFTADPAALVVGDTVYLHVGHDEARPGEMFVMKEWLCYSSKDMKTWAAHGPVMKPTDFAWAAKDAWAAQAVQRNGKFYLYTTVTHAAPIGGMAIGVAVANQPCGPFIDARGSALVTDKMTPSPHWGDDIDPTVLVDDDGTAWLAWGNPNLYLARLKPNMTELDGSIQRLFVPNYTEGPWLHKRGGLYYLTYASFAHQGFAERICYATATSLAGPWTYRGILTGAAHKSYTIHPAIIDFKGQSYFFYHNAALTLPDGQSGGLGRRAVGIEYLHYNPDGSLQPIEQTEAGVSLPAKTPPPAVAVPAARGATDAGVKVTPFTGDGPVAWPGAPALATVTDPLNQAPWPVSFNRDEGATRIGQTFAPDADITLGRVSLFAGDGFGTDEKHPIVLALYDLGPAGAAAADADTYSASINLLGSGLGLPIAYEVQAPGLLHLDFDVAGKVVLKAGRRYAFELQGERNSAPVFWRRSRADAYAAGAAYRDRKLVREKDGKTSDFALAIYPAR